MRLLYLKDITYIIIVMNFNISKPITIGFKKNYRSRGRNIICGNCGRRGHVYKECLEPIISIGIVAFKEVGDTLKYVMVRRKDTHGYVEFIRGKYDVDDLEYLSILFNEMTSEEKNKLENTDFLTLWKKLWLIENMSSKKKEFVLSSNKFNYLLENKYIEKLVKESTSNWKEPEWGFPKGKRNIREDNLSCAHREFQEETGLESSDYFVFDNIKPFYEVFYGSNSIKYKHIYYIGKIYKKKELKINTESRSQISEIGDIGYFTLDKCLNIIRPYNKEKKKVINKIHYFIKKENLFNKGFEFKTLNYYNVKPSTI